MPYKKSKKNSTSSKKSNTGGRRRKHTVKKARRVRNVMRGGVTAIGGSLPNLVTFKDIIDTVGSEQSALTKFKSRISKDWMNTSNTEVYGPDQESFEKNPSIISMRDDELTKDGAIQYLLSKWRSVRYPSTQINALLLKREFSVDDIVYILFHKSITQLVLRSDLFKPVNLLESSTKFESLNQDDLKKILKENAQIKELFETAIREKYLKEQDSNNWPLTDLIGRYYTYSS